MYCLMCNEDQNITHLFSFYSYGNFSLTVQEILMSLSSSVFLLSVNLTGVELD